MYVYMYFYNGYVEYYQLSDVAFIFFVWLGIYEAVTPV